MVQWGIMGKNDGWGRDCVEQRDFFISYANEDEAWAEWIARILTENGYSVYIQMWNIRPGDNFLEKMNEFLQHSRNFIAVWSRNYEKSGYCMDELNAAYHRRHEKMMDTLLPIRVEEFPMLSLYAALVHVDLYSVGRTEEGKRLVLNSAGYEAPRLHIIGGRNGPLEDSKSAEMLNEEGLNYYYGRKGLSVDCIKAKEYWEYAARKGNADAMCSLGWLYQNGQGVCVNYAKAREYYEFAAEKGNANALNDLGLLYYYGVGVDVNYRIAREYYEQAAWFGHAYALNNLGYLYDYGVGVKVDYGKARAYYEQAAEKGNADALNNLGWMYYDGHGVVVNYTKARYYYERAAKKNNPYALYNLGLLYEYGEGAPQRYDKALEYYQQATDAGNESAPAKVEELRQKLNT